MAQDKKQQPTREDRISREDKLTRDVQQAGEPDDRIAVKVLKKGYYGHRIVKVGEVIRVERSAFSARWMKLTKVKPVEEVVDEDGDPVDPVDTDPKVSGASDANVL